MMAGMGRTVRLRSVDTNPIFLPSRFWATDRIGLRAGDGDRFAKCATVVTELYSRHLEHGPPLPAETSWVRFVPTSRRGPQGFSGVAATQDLGMGEVHQVPYDPDVLALPDEQRRLAILDWLHTNLCALAVSLSWPTEPLRTAYDGCIADRCSLHHVGEAKTSRNRWYTAHVEYEIDGDGDAWSWATITATTRAWSFAANAMTATPATCPLGGSAGPCAGRTTTSAGRHGPTRPYPPGTPKSPRPRIYPYRNERFAA
jgi:hypothetical protein